MPRKPRLFLPDQPQHVVVRGHNRDPVLAREDDFRYLYQSLRGAARQYGLAIHAWVFMHNHIHLLATPADEQSLAKTMQSVGRRYAQYFNRSYHRSGALWEGRYKSSMIDTDRYLLACYRYIELNPVRAGIVKKPADYPYSSYHANALGKKDSLVTPHPVFQEFIGAGGASGAGVGVNLYDNSENSTPMRVKLTPTPEIRGAAGFGVNLNDSQEGNTPKPAKLTPTPEETHASWQDAETHDTAQNQAGTDPGDLGREAYRELCTRMLDRKTLTTIRRGTEKGLGIGQADFLLKVARLAGGS